MDPKFVTAVQHDWPTEKQVALQSLVESAYADAGANCDPTKSPIFSTPNQHFHTGQTRWIAMNYWLHHGCTIGLLSGIQAVWKPIFEKQTKGFWKLELQGKYTSLIACHVSDIEDSPRDTMTRRDYRLGNQCMMHFLKEEIDDGSLLNLTLVHGNKRAEFAYLRGYNDPKNSASYLPFSGNIMSLPSLAEPVEEEDISDPETDIKDDFRDEDEQEGEQS